MGAIPAVIDFSSAMGAGTAALPDWAWAEDGAPVAKAAPSAAVPEFLKKSRRLWERALMRFYFLY
jgi:hypothetical protein